MQTQDLQLFQFHVFSFEITYREAITYRKLTGNVVHKNSWSDLTVDVYIVL